MRQYHEKLIKILTEGDLQYDDRTKMYTLGVASDSKTYDLREGFPLMTSKKIPMRVVAEELFWKLRGESGVKPLVDRQVHIWTANAFDFYLKRNGMTEQIPKHSKEWNEGFESYKRRLVEDLDFARSQGTLGDVYGKVVRGGFERDGKPIDQLTEMLDKIKNEVKTGKSNRYEILTSWHPGKLHLGAIGSCAFWHQSTVYGNQFELTMLQRSDDVYVGDPFNSAQDALLTHMIAQDAGLVARRFHHHSVNTHIYLGVAPRNNFWLEGDNKDKFQEMARQITNRCDYKDLREWYLRNAPAESPGNEKKDHMSFVLEQLTKEPRPLPRLILSEGPLLELIQRPADEVVRVEGYDPHIWDSKAVMAA